MKTKIFLIVFTCIVILQLYFNKQVIYYLLNNKKNIPTPEYIVKVIKNSIKNKIILNNNFIFYDIGCGNGSMINKVFEPNVFKKYIGIEYDYETHKNSESTDEMIDLVLDNALTYNYLNEPSVIYLYEPFFSFNYNDATKMYHELFKQIKTKCRKTIYLVYLTGNLFLGSPHLYKSKLLNKYKLISKENIYQPLLLRFNKLFVYQIN